VLGSLISILARRYQCIASSGLSRSSSRTPCTRRYCSAGTPAFCSRILEVVASEPFDLGHGVFLRKTCSIGWAPYPWCRENFEAICAEEVIALADAALYRAKGGGRNQGIGILPGAAGGTAPATIALEAIQKIDSTIARVVRTDCPGREQTLETTYHSPDFIDQSAV